MIKWYDGIKSCCDCGRTAHWTVIKNGYQFTVCGDCVADYEEEENED